MHNEDILSFLMKFKYHPNKIFLLDLLKYVLKNNAFKFDNTIFMQLCGMAMGTRLAPALATIYVGDLEEAIIDNRLKQLMHWFRYIDDAFTIWTHTIEDFPEFLDGLNSVHPKIHSLPISLHKLAIFWTLQFINRQSSRTQVNFPKDIL